MKTRVISAFILVPLLLFVWLGGYPLVVAAFAIGSMSMWEFYKGFENVGIKPHKGIGITLLACLYVIYIKDFYIGLPEEKPMELIMFWMFISVAVGLIIALAAKNHNIQDGPVTMIGVIYLGYFSSHVVLIDNVPEQAILIWLVFITAFCTDTFAYFVGVAMGKHKLCPTLSPKKTIEGSIGGIVGSVVFSVLFGYVFAPEYLSHCFFIGLIGSGFAQAGDLIASAFKRKLNIKDYGNLIPGHGGILDRFDSIMLTAPFVYYYITLVINR